MTSRLRVVIRHMTSLLTGKTAVIYGGGGNIGGAAARAFAREGAQVHLVGRTRESLDRVAADTGAEVAVPSTPPTRRRSTRTPTGSAASTSRST